MTTRLAVHLFSPRFREIKASKAKEPPSPLLSARIATPTYLNVTTSISDQKIRLSTPKMCSGSTASGCGPMKLSFIA